MCVCVAQTERTKNKQIACAQLTNRRADRRTHAAKQQRQSAPSDNKPLTLKETARAAKRLGSAPALAAPLVVALYCGTN